MDYVAAIEKAAGGKLYNLVVDSSGNSICLFSKYELNFSYCSISIEK